MCKRSLSLGTQTENSFLTTRPDTFFFSLLGRFSVSFRLFKHCFSPEPDLSSALQHSSAAHTAVALEKPPWIHTHVVCAAPLDFFFVLACLLLQFRALLGRLQIVAQRLFTPRLPDGKT